MFSIGDIVTTSDDFNQHRIEGSVLSPPPDSVGIIMEIMEYSKHTGETIRFGVAWFDWQPKIRTRDGLLWYDPTSIKEFGK